MRKNSFLLNIMVLLLVVGLTGCAGAGFKKTGKGVDNGEEKVSDKDVAPVVIPQKGGAVTDISRRGDMTDADLENIYFEYNQYAIRDNARRVLEKNAGYLRSNPGVNIVVEGSCDERGTQTYNLALGQRRADSVKKYLTDLGISPSRVRTVTYGEERQVCTARTESCWGRNRRVSFTR